ncbi:MAG: IS4 family transposase [Acidobacteria bacterium]|nr:IS4 family transposase [Acidobacteriota bacterium]
MQRFSSIFSQLLQLFPRSEFELAVKKHNSDYCAKRLSSWGQFVAMLFCQLGRAHSLREICQGLASCEGKLRHLGVKGSPKHSTLGYANAHRPWSLYQTIFEQLLSKCQMVATGRGRKKFRFKNKLVSLDSTTIDLSVSLFDWARFRRTKGAIKLHLLLDHDGYLPSFAVVTTGDKGEITVARRLRFEPGTVIVMDRGYIDYEWFVELSRNHVYFVTRLKENASFEVVESRPVVAGTNVRKDQIIFFHSQAVPDSKHFFRIVEVWDEEKQRSVTFLTNQFKFAATTIAAIYKDRWAVELFFKAIKQNLKIKTFLGTNANAVKTQIWTALIAMLILRYLQLMSTFGWSLSNLAALLRHQLFVYRGLFEWLNAPFEGPPQLAGATQQLSLEIMR